LSKDEPFVDLYGTLKVHPECDAKALELAYRHLAKLYHPDHPETADIDSFTNVVDAYRILRSHDLRAQYNERYAAETGFLFSPIPIVEEADEEGPLSDSDAHSRILFHLYRRRREFPKEPGVGHHTLMDLLGCSEENIDFHVWYLKEKGFLASTENGTLAITIEGVDQVISTSRTTAAERLRITQSPDL
jgi:curved DNA-binding protein